MGLGKAIIRRGRGRGDRDRPRQLRLDLPTEQDHVPLPGLSSYQAMADDYEVLGLSPDAHPMQFLREGLGGGVRTTEELRSVAGGTAVRTAGLVVCRQRPGTAEGAIYLLLEDEVGLVNVMITPGLYERYRTEVRTSPFLGIRGVIDHVAGDVAMVRANIVHPLKPTDGPLSTPGGKNWG